MARWGSILLHVQSEPNSLMVQFKGNTLKPLCSALRNKAKQFLRWDWETTLARLRPRVSAGVEVTLVALPELCLLVRIRPEKCKDNHTVNKFLPQQKHCLTHYTHNYPGYKRNIWGEATPFIRLAEITGKGVETATVRIPKISLLSVILSASLN